MVRPAAIAVDELRRRASRLRLVVSDNDGVLTDAGVWYSERGEELKRYSLRDGMGFELLRGSGLRTAILTRESTGLVAARARKLEVDFLWQGVRDKLAWLPHLCAAARVEPEQVAFIGDDVNDAGLLQLLCERSLTGAPVDAHASALRFALFQSVAPGGHGAFREFVDWLIALRSGGPGANDDR
jgi:3-deoxy-D-manno-octulosonate 8-phosphate phosphatase (KDO 8-P phosphatase)